MNDAVTFPPSLVVGSTDPCPPAKTPSESNAKQRIRHPPIDRRLPGRFALGARVRSKEFAPFSTRIIDAGTRQVKYWPGTDGNPVDCAR